MSKIGILLLLLSFFSPSSFGNGNEQFFLNLKSSLRLGQQPADVDQVLRDIFFSKESYTASTEEFCNFFAIPSVRWQADKVLEKFNPRQVTWYQNFNSKIARCRTPKISVFDSWIRKLEFNFLLFGEKTRNNYLLRAKHDPRLTTASNIFIARTYGAEGNNAKFEQGLKNAVDIEMKKAKPDVEALGWAYVFLANVRINAGDFNGAEKYLGMINEKSFTTEAWLREEFRIVQFHKELAQSLAGEKNPQVKLPAFCEEKAPSYMRYRELEICLVADILLNKKMKSSYLAELEPLLPTLLPVQIPLVTATLIALQDKGLSVRTNLTKFIAEIELPVPEQTMFKFIFDYAKKNEQTKAPVEINKVIDGMGGRYSLFGLVARPIEKTEVKKEAE